MNKDLKIKIILANFLTFILRRICLELHQGAELEGEGSDVGAAGEVVLVRGDVGGEGGFPDSGRSSSDIQEVDHIHGQAHMLVPLEIHTAESFPAGIKEQGVGDVDIAPAVVAGAQPESPFAGLVGRLQLDLGAAAAGDPLPGEIIFLGISVAEDRRETIVLVPWNPEGEQAVEGEALERSQDHVRGPSEDFHVIE